MTVLLIQQKEDREMTKLDDRKVARVSKIVAQTAKKLKAVLGSEYAIGLRQAVRELRGMAKVKKTKVAKRTPKKVVKAKAPRKAKVVEVEDEDEGDEEED